MIIASLTKMTTLTIKDIIKKASWGTINNDLENVSLSTITKDDIVLLINSFPKITSSKFYDRQKINEILSIVADKGFVFDIDMYEIIFDMYKYSTNLYLPIKNKHIIDQFNPDTMVYVKALRRCYKFPFDVKDLLNKSYNVAEHIFILMTPTHDIKSLKLLMKNYDIVLTQKLYKNILLYGSYGSYITKMIFNHPLKTYDTAWSIQDMDFIDYCHTLTDNHDACMAKYINKNKNTITTKTFLLACNSTCSIDVLFNIFNNKLSFNDDEIEEAFYYLLSSRFLIDIVQLFISNGTILSQKHYLMLSMSPFYKKIFLSINISNMILDNIMLDNIIKLILSGYGCAELINKFINAYKGNENIAVLCCIEYCGKKAELKKSLKNGGFKLTSKCLLYILKNKVPITKVMLEMFANDNVDLTTEILIQYIKNYVKSASSKALTSVFKC